MRKTFVVGRLSNRGTEMLLLEHLKLTRRERLEMARALLCRLGRRTPGSKPPTATIH